MSAIFAPLACGYKTNSFNQGTTLKGTHKRRSDAKPTQKLSYSPIASFIIPQLSKIIFPYTPHLPIILGETHDTANAPLALYYHSDMLKENGVRILAREAGQETELYQQKLNKVEKMIPALQNDIRKIMDAPKLPQHICDKLSLWLTDSEVKKFLKSSLFDDEKPPFEETVQYHPCVMRFGKELEPFALSLLGAFSNNKEKLREIYYTRKIPDTNPLDIATILLQFKGFNFHCIDMGRHHIAKITGNSLSNDGMILRDQGMMEEIQDLQRKHFTNVIGVIGLFHMIALKENYPNSAVYKDIMGVKKLSLRDIRNGRELTSEERYSANVNFKTCLKDAFRPRNLDAELIEPADEVTEVRCRLRQKQESEKAKILDKIEEGKE